MKDKWLLMLGGLVVVIAVFGLKVWHAQGICGDLGGSCLMASAISTSNPFLAGCLAGE